MATHPSPQIVGADLGIITTEIDAPYYWDLVGYLLSQFPYLASKGVAGYAYFIPNATAPVFGNTTLQSAGMLGSFVITDTQSAGDMYAIWAPIFDHVARTWPGVSAAPNITVHPSFLDWYSTHYDQGTAGSNLYAGSHLLDERALSANATANGEAFKSFGKNGGTAFLVAGKGTWEAKPRGGSTAVLPSWRRTVVHASELSPLAILLGFYLLLRPVHISN